MVLATAAPAKRRRRPPPGPPTLASPVAEYARDVVAGRIVAGLLVRRACERHLGDLERTDVRFDEDEAARAIEFFGHLKQSKGRWSGEVLVLLPWQAFAIGAIFGWKRLDGCRRFRHAYISLARKNGKTTIAAGVAIYLMDFDREPGAEVYAAAPLATDTPIATAEGWKSMGDLCVDDVVYGADGSPCKVLSTSPIWQGRPCYEVSFDDGATIVTDAEHLWTVDSVHLGISKAGLPRSAAPRVGRTLTTAQIGETMRTPLGRANYRIRAAGALQTAEIPLPIPPYTLGAWLGDGRANRGAMVLHPNDHEIAERIEADGYTISRQNDPNGLLRFTPLGLRTPLRIAGLLDNKHVPAEYLRSSVAQRTALLQGLLDTDGTCTKTGEIRFTNRNRAIAEAVYELECSLGIIARFSETQVTGRSHWRVSCRTDIPLFMLARKAARQVAAGKRALRRRIVGVRSVPSRPVRCIAVESPDHLFLAGRGLIATHNTKRDQARICWVDAERMVRASASLKKRIKIINSRANMHVPETNSKFEALGADNDSTDGLNIHGAILDELHQHKTRGLLDALEKGTSSRRQPLLLYITTAGLERASIYAETDDYARRVVLGAVEDDEWFVYIAQLDDEDDWRDSALYEKANPSLGVTVQLEELEHDRDRALEVPGRLNPFKRFNLNRRTGQFSAWFSAEQWDACRDDFRWGDLVGRQCFAGLDLASTTDVASLVLLFPDPEGDYVVPLFWIPESASARGNERGREHFPEWCERGFITKTSGDIIDYDVIREAIRELSERFRIVEIAFDPWNATQLITQLQGDGANCIAVRQGFASLSAPSKELEGVVAARRIRHDGNPVLRWMVLNAQKAEDDAGNIKPSRSKSADKIDGLVAMIMALSRSMVHDKSDGRSVYESRGLLEV